MPFEIFKSESKVLSPSWNATVTDSIAGKAVLRFFERAGSGREWPAFLIGVHVLFLFNFLRYLVVACLVTFAILSRSTAAESGPPYEAAGLKITPRSVVSLENARQLHVVVVVENKSSQDVRVSVGANQAATYAFDESGGKWTMADSPTGIANGHDGCSTGTILHEGEVRPVLYRLVSSQRSSTPALVTFGTFLYRCGEGRDVGVPVSIDGIPVQAN